MKKRKKIDTNIREEATEILKKQKVNNNKKKQEPSSGRKIKELVKKGTIS